MLLHSLVLFCLRISASMAASPGIAGVHRAVFPFQSNVDCKRSSLPFPQPLPHLHSQFRSRLQQCAYSRREIAAQVSLSDSTGPKSLLGGRSQSSSSSSSAGMIEGDPAFASLNPLSQSERSLHLTRVQSSASTSSSGFFEDADGGSGTGGWGGGGKGGGGSDGEGRGEADDGNSDNHAEGGGGLLGGFLRGWKRRVRADPQFAFKVFSEEFIGVGACVLGDMASRPNFGLNELDFVFSTIIVGSILNFTLMYMLAPTAAAGQVSARLPLLFAACPPGHMFEAGKYSLLDRAGTFLYKGVQFSAVGFAAGLVGTALSNLLLSVRKKVDPKFEIQNKAPPTVLNALTWAGHMGLSANARYQTLNGVEFYLARLLHPATFKAAVFVMRGLNNVLGGVTFVMLARRTGSQSAPKAIESQTASPNDAAELQHPLHPEQSS